MITKELLIRTLITRTTPQAKKGTTCTYDKRVNGGCTIGCLLPDQLSYDTPSYLPASKILMNEPQLFNNDITNEFINSVQVIHDARRLWNNHKTGELVNGFVWNKQGINQINDIIKKYNVNVPLIVVY